MDTDDPQQSEISPPSLTTPEQALQNPLSQPTISGPEHVQLTTTESYSIRHTSGPLPSADELRQFGNIDKSLPDRIMVLAESEQTHRHALENKAVDAEIQSKSDSLKLQFRGQKMAFCIAILFLVSGTGLTLAGHPVAGSAFSGFIIITIASLFITGRLPNNKTEESDPNV